MTDVALRERPNASGGAINEKMTDWGEILASYTGNDAELSHAREKDKEARRKEDGIHQPLAISRARHARVRRRERVEAIILD